MKIVLAADSAGKPLLDVIATHLANKPGLKVVDMSRRPDDAPEYYAETAERAALAIRAGKFDRGIFCCGTGIGVCMSANKVPGIRAAHVHDVYSADRAVKSNNAQVITMGARVIGSEHAKLIVDTFLAATFDPASHSAANVDAIDALDRRHHKE